MSCRITTGGIIQQTQVLQLRYNQSLPDSLLSAHGYSFKILINLTDVRSPYSTNPTASFAIATNVYYNNSNYLIDVMSDPLLYPSVLPSPFLDLAVSRSSDSPMNSTNLHFNITTSCQMPTNTVFFVRIPETQVIVRAMPGSTPQCQELSGRRPNSLPCAIDQD